MPTHQEIRISFELHGRRYEAVGFLPNGQSSVNVQEMFRLTDVEKGGAIGEDDETHFLKYRTELPNSLERYALVTKRALPGNPRSYAYYRSYVRSWSRDWLASEAKCTEMHLVVRRLA